MKTGPCNCSMCSQLCLRKPGWFAPGQATKAAAEVGMSLVDFFKQYLTREFCVTDYAADSDGDHSTRVFMLSPAWRGNNGKTAGYGDNKKRGPCALLTPTGCRLSFDNRPRECQISFGCEPIGKINVRANQDLTVTEWKAAPDELQLLEKAGVLDVTDDGGDYEEYGGMSLFGGWGGF